MMGEKIRDHYTGYMTLKGPDVDDDRSIYVGPYAVVSAKLWQWSRDNGYVKTRSVATPEGYAPRSTSGIAGGEWDEDAIDMRRVRQFISEAFLKERAEWPDEANAMCARLERKIGSLMRLLSAEMTTRERLDRDVRSLKADVAEAKRATVQANSATEEMKRRAKDSDPDRIRRDVAAEHAEHTAKLDDEIRQLRHELHDTKSQVEKLTEDKRRLRAALNSSRSTARR